MAKCLVGAAGGLSAADKAKLTPKNIRAGVTIAKVTGTLTWQDLLPSPIVAVQNGNPTNTELFGTFSKFSSNPDINPANGYQEFGVSSAGGGVYLNKKNRLLSVEIDIL